VPLSLVFQTRRAVALHTSDLVYDWQAQLNMVDIEGKLMPAIDQPMRLPTNSKTRQSPGDDDPDVGRENLY
jgi:hypothetical protein